MAFPNFFGKQYESASNFLDDLEMAFLVSGRDEEEVKLRAFPLVLKDSAKNWFQNLEQGKKTNWETLKETFLSKYGGLDNPEHLWHRISSLHQATSRTYLTYESQFLRLWAEWEASLAEGERAPNFLKKEKFLAGLFPDLQEKVKGKFPETFEEALQIARVKDRKLEYQAHTSRVEHPQGPTMADERLPPAPTTTPEDPHLELLQRVTNQLDNLSINMVQGVRQQQPQPNNERMPNGPRRQPQRRDYFCYNCGEEGHGMYFCPHPRNFNAQAGRGRQQVTPPRARPPPQIQPQILQNPQMVAQPQVLQRSVSPQPVAEIPPLPNNNVAGADRLQPVLGQQPPLPHKNRAMIRYAQPYETPQPMSNAPMLTYYEEPNESYITEPEQPMYAEEPYQSWEMNEGMAQSSYVAQPSRDQYLVDERTLMFIANQNYKQRGYHNRERQPMGPPLPNQQPIGPCFNCGSPDHWERSCPHKGQRVKIYGFCNDCGIKHILPDCPRNPDNKGKTTLNKVGVLPSASSGSETEPVVQVNVVTRAQAKELEKEKPVEENTRVPVPTKNGSLSVRTQRKSWKAKHERMKARRAESQTAIQEELQEVKQQLQLERESKKIEQNNQPRKAPSGGSVLVDKVLELLDALLQQWEARLNNTQTLEQRWLTYPYPKVETKRLEMCKDLIRAAQALMEPNVVRALEREVLIHKHLDKQRDK
ncbi:hypothetical protein L7F22_049161 [Adiantum nelumboides]|nr:hypothetical protein [Adiantum nelumboides]